MLSKQEGFDKLSLTTTITLSLSKGDAISMRMKEVITDLIRHFEVEGEILLKGKLLITF